MCVCLCTCVACAYWVPASLPCTPRSVISTSHVWHIWGMESQDSMPAVWLESPWPYPLPHPGSFVTNRLMTRERLFPKLCVPSAGISLLCIGRKRISAPFWEPFYSYSRHGVSNIGDLDILHLSIWGALTKGGPSRGWMVIVRLLVV